jgi:hypothetical protein
VVAALLVNVRGVAQGGLEWGPRFLLPVYPALAGLAAAGLKALEGEERRWEHGVGRVLVALGLAFQLLGLLRIDRMTPWNRAYGNLIASLSGPVVLRPGYLVQNTPGLTQGREVYCVESASGLRRWLELAESAGERRFWYVDWSPLPAQWLQPGTGAPSSLGTLQAQDLFAAQYSVSELRALVRLDSRPVERCGASLDT